MEYFKIICNGEFAGLATGNDGCRYQNKHNIIWNCHLDNAQYFLVDGVLYRDEWLAEETASFDSVKAEISRITEEEYNSIKAVLDEGKEVEITEDVIEPEEEPDVPDAEEDITLEYAKAKKIASMSQRCSEAITNGVEIELSDGEKYVFSFGITDQLRIVQLYDLAMSGGDFLPYHANGQQTVNYDADDIIKIKQTMDYTIEYNTSYFGSLREYINSMDKVSDVAAVEYGMDIPEEYQSDVLKMLNGDETALDEAFAVNQERISDLEDAVIELADLIGG